MVFLFFCRGILGKKGNKFHTVRQTWTKLYPSGHMSSTWLNPLFYVMDLILIAAFLRVLMSLWLQPCVCMPGCSEYCLVVLLQVIGKSRLFWLVT